MGSCLLNLCTLRCVQIIRWRKDLLQPVGPGAGLPLRLRHDEARSARLETGVNEGRPRFRMLRNLLQAKSSILKGDTECTPGRATTRAHLV